MSLKIDVLLDVTLCTNEQSRNFLKVGLHALDIDLAGNVEEQAQAAVVAGIKVLKVLNGGLCEQVEEVVSGFDGVPVVLREELGRVKLRVEHLEGKLIPRIVEKTKELIVRIDGLDALAERKQPPPVTADALKAMESRLTDEVQSVGPAGSPVKESLRGKRGVKA